MKIYTNKNNTSTLKLLIAAKLARKKVEIIEANFDDKIFSGPRQLPILSVDDQITFFSSNAAVQYLFSIIDLSTYGECFQLQEWEATRLSPLVATALLGKATSDLKQALSALVQVVDARLGKHPFVLGNKLSPADISIFATLYPLIYRDDLRAQYLAETSKITTWAQTLNTDDVKEAIKEWGGSLDGPFGATSALGIPQLSSVATPVGSPEEAVETGPSADEITAAKEAWENGLCRLPAPIKQEKVVLPVKGRKNVLITSALPYVNNVPHLGNIIGCVLSADIFARYCRICDYNTLFICGTDEYGTATETKALEENLTPKQICDKYFEIHNSVYRWFNIGFDYFGRTSTPEQTEITQKMFLKLKDNGFISSQTVDQLLCQKCDRFLADRFVEGTCPHPGCLYDSARGDQCDKCGKLINAIELISPRCKVCSTTPVVRPSEQLFIELGLIEPSLRSWLSTGIDRWSPPARAVSRSWLREPLRARAVTRDLKWGVPVPVPGYQNKVFYVWFDAPLGYMSITQAATKDYEQWWKPNKEHDVQLYQFMAKDNVPFHAIMFPAALLGVNEGHTTVNYLYATEYLNYEEGKFSKSRGVGVFGTDAQDTGIPADVWRFYLASIRPETSDSSFSWTELGTRNNSELLNNLGNFCHRSLSFCASAFKGRVPDVMLTETDCHLFALVNRDVIAYVQHMEKGRLREALRQVLSISKRGNQHMQSEQPWVLLKGSDIDKVRGATAIGVCCQLVALTCALLQPYMPQTCRKLRAQLNVNEHALRINPASPSLLKYLPPGHIIGKPEPLFTKIEQATLDELRAKYAGTQSDRANKEAFGSSLAELEKAIAEQGEKVRQLKSTTKDKSVWQPEVDKLLALKKQLATAQTLAKPPPGAQSVESLEKSIAEQGEKVRQLKSTTKDKSVWQPEVDKLLALKKQLATAQTQAKPPPGAQSVETLEKSIAEQGEKVRQLKSTTKDKSVWQPEVDKLLALKKQLATAQTQAKPPAGAQSVESLEKSIAEQGEKVRQLKSTTKDKSVWQPEVDKLLALKKQLATAQTQAKPPTGDSKEALEKAIAEQGEKVRLLKSTTKDKSVWQPEVDKLLALKKQLATAQTQAKPPPGDSKEALEKAIAEQGEKVRQLKASTKDKAVWQPEVTILLDLKKKLSAL